MLRKACSSSSSALSTTRFTPIIVARPVLCARSFATQPPSGTTPASTPTPNPAKSRRSFPAAHIFSFFLGSALSLYVFHSYSAYQQRKKDNPKLGTALDFQHAVRILCLEFPEDGKVTDDIDDLYTHGFMEGDYHNGALHSVIVYPESTEDVVKIVKIATRFRMPIIPYSGGTCLEGQTRGHKYGGICVDMSRMDKILAVNEADGDLVCQAGAGWMDINETLKRKGIPLFFPLDPAPGATIGGMIATGCSGTNAVRYGTAKGEWFLNLTVVLPSGEVIKTRQRARKSSAGFDLTKLFIGSEGTLGIVTEATLRLAPVLPTTVAVVHFPDVKKATQAIREILNKGVGIQCIELVDDSFMLASNLANALHTHKPSLLSSLNPFASRPKASSRQPYAESDSLFLKFTGPTPASLFESSQLTRKICESSKYGGYGWREASSPSETTAIWNDRKNAHYSGLVFGSVHGKTRGWPTDVCVPVSRLPDLVLETKKDLKSVGLPATIVGHAGDGNFHAQVLFDPEKDGERERAEGVVHRMVERAIEMDGTCTGEHGVGIGKRMWLERELGEGTVGLMWEIKRMIDPLGIFNPGKLYPDRPKLP